MVPSKYSTIPFYRHDSSVKIYEILPLKSEYIISKIRKHCLILQGPTLFNSVAICIRNWTAHWRNSSTHLTEIYTTYLISQVMQDTQALWAAASNSLNYQRPSCSWSRSLGNQRKVYVRLGMLLFNNVSNAAATAGNMLRPWLLMLLLMLKPSASPVPPPPPQTPATTPPLVPPLPTSHRPYSGPRMRGAKTQQSRENFTRQST